jgi:hypothetical protein
MHPRRYICRLVYMHSTTLLITSRHAYPDLTICPVDCPDQHFDNRNITTLLRMSRSPSPAPSDESDVTRASCDSCPPWPESDTVISHIALNSHLDEISNSTKGAGLATILSNHISKRQRRGPNPRITTEPALFDYYQTETYGPQFGYRLLMVQEGNNVDSVAQRMYALGTITPETGEMVIFTKNGEDMIVLPNNASESSKGDRIAIDFVIGLPCLTTISANNPNSLSNYLHQHACRSERSRLTIWPNLIRLTYGSEDENSSLDGATSFVRSPGVGRSHSYC